MSRRQVFRHRLRLTSGSRVTVTSDAAIRLNVDPDGRMLTSTIVTGAEASDVGPRSTYKNGAATSVWTGETFGGEYIQERALAGELGQILLAVAVTRPGSGGRSFRAPTEADHAAVQEAEDELRRLLPAWEIADLVPDEPVPPGHKTDEPRRMGLVRWRDMFSPRQLLANVTALEVLQEVAARGSKAARRGGGSGGCSLPGVRSRQGGRLQRPPVELGCTPRLDSGTPSTGTTSHSSGRLPS